MTSAVQADFFTVMRERHAVKHFDPAHKLSKSEITFLLEMAGSAPSAWNLQPWRFLVIADQRLQEKLLPVAYGQRQVVEASAVIAVLGDLEAHRDADMILSRDVAAGLMPEEIKANLCGQIEAAYLNNPQVPRDEAIRNASLAAMQLMLTAKAIGYDTCPMGGYDPAALIEAFDIPSRYIPVMLVAVGKAAQPARPSTRLSAEQTVVWNGF
ncbi:nitroreductase family protein [Paenibacillus macerans]|uniref:Putative NAD(P)H nitroreductase yodC n=1 Tax=Paenibacillus macerans TaxID=44252 RepID=A0A090ZK47_PAEMA|nr:nitroreductase family protein [Paenibacillus macerans]KFN11007.1 putative NAD(P)H nitroreductase yodC [Paenibacillus macerans]MCY7560860.1 nitroreductase family protein [Paenibacillus macerans]MEC0152220.1 nitroreductase family protein [Paenibacillus macerans]SUA83481.1 NADH nitroreductase [Paenibacillus macerans]GBK61896.1 nitroreductase family protein [Paenibacillus macerans]